MQSLPTYTLCLFSMLLNVDIADIEKADKICSPTFVVDQLSRLLWHPSIFTSIIILPFIKDLRSA